MRKPIVFLTVLMIGTSLQAQTAADSVKATVNQLFAAMKAVDTVALKAVFSNNALMQTVAVDTMGKVSVENASPALFAKSIARHQPGNLDEQIVFDMVKVDGDLAAVWTPYTFYFKGNKLHCGANSFQLVRIDGAWKIQYIIDTRRKNCQ
jgi:hypothetical protein